MSSLFKIGAVTVAVIMACCATAVIVVPSVPAAAQAREEQARRLCAVLDEATRSYRAAEGAHPPGDGRGSMGLAMGLLRPARRGRPYVSFAPTMLTEEGHVRNPVDPVHAVFHYRCNESLDAATRLAVAAQNADAFDLWACDAEGREAGVNNWTWE